MRELTVNGEHLEDTLMQRREDVSFVKVKSYLENVTVGIVFEGGGILYV
jgi:hypothetical protein